MKKILTLLGMLMSTSLAYATNGTNLIGFGAESTFMAGADTAVARDTSALNTNPAGLTQIRHQRYDLYGSLLRTTDLSHQDQFGNDKHANNLYTGLGGMGYASKLANHDCTLGAGLFAQGGSGGVFKNLKTAFGTEDQFSALFAVMKLTSGMGCKVDSKWSVGASAGLVYAMAEQKLFPNTSVGTTFSGLDIEDLGSLGASLKLGLQYQATDKLKLAATYTSKTNLPLSGGKLTANMTGAGLGMVRYNNVKIKGLTLPEEIGLGAAYQVTEAWLLSLKLNWLNWSGAMKTTELLASQANHALAPDLRAVSTMDWDNQWVIALGTAYQYSDKTTLYAGYNYGKNPIPSEHSTPVIAGIFDHHLTGGVGYQYNQEWTLFAGFEYDFRNKVDYNNAELPFGDAQVRNEAIWLHMMVSRQW